jgi:hypothetical protein
MRDALNCTETVGLTGCPARVVSPSCPIFPPPHLTFIRFCAVLDRTRWHVVESAWGAVLMLPSVPFPRPLSEPAVRVSTQRALHGIYRQAGCGTVPGVGDRVASIPAVQLPEPTNHPVPHEVLQGVHGVFGYCMPEVVRPAAHDLVQPDQHGPGWLLRQSARQGTNFVLQRPDGPVGDEGVDVPLGRSSLAAPLDTKARRSPSRPRGANDLRSVDYGR